jgi:predicted PurR-regulated permease PerM
MNPAQINAAVAGEPRTGSKRTRWITFSLVLGFSLLALWIFLTKLQSISIPFFLSVILSLLLEPPVNFLESKGLGRLQAILIIFAGILIVILIAILAIWPALITQVHAIRDQFTVTDLSGQIESLSSLLEKKLQFLGAAFTAENINLKIQALFTEFQSRLLKFAIGILSAFSNLLIIPFITFFLLKDGPAFKKRVIQAVPNRYFEMVLNLIYKIEQQLGGYIRGQLIDAFLVGILSIIALSILGVPYYILIGALAGLANLIPYFGPVVGAVPAIVVSLMHNPSFSIVLWIAVAFAIVQLIDNIVISPLVVARSVNIHPLIVIVVVLIGERLLGVLGMLLAVPVTAILNVILRETIWSFKNYRL